MKKRIGFVALLLLTLGWLHPAQAQSGLSQTAGSWSNEFAPARSDHQFQFEVQFPLVWNDGLYATTYAPLSLSSLMQGPGVVSWDGQQWVGLGKLKGRAAAITVHQDRLYVFGHFSLNGQYVSMAYWDGQTWVIVATSVINNWTNVQLQSYQNDLYLSSSTLLELDGVTFRHIARWDGTQWHSLGAGVNGEIYALAAGSDGLYVGGSQLAPINSSVRGDLLRWDGTQWSQVGNGLSGKVLELTWANNQLYVGGTFNFAISSASRARAKNIVVWNGTAWRRLGEGIRFEVHSIVINDHMIYALEFNGTTLASIYRWNGTTWEFINGLDYQTVDNASIYPVGQLAAYQGQIVILGNFVLADQRNSFVLDGRSVQAMMQRGLITGVPSISSAGEKIYAWSNNQPLNWGAVSSSIAYYDQVYGWFALGKPANSETIVGVFRADDVVYAATNSGLYRHVRDSTWNQISATTGINQLAVDGYLLYVAGDFDQFNQQPAHNLGMWDGQQWRSINAPASFETITALDVLNGIVYITDGSQVARWDGRAWTTLATNVNQIKVLEATLTGVYIGGNFSRVQGVDARKLAYWEPSGWRALDEYLLGDVYDLELGSDGLYVAGRFFRPVSLNEQSISITRWDGNAWQSVGGGLEKIYSAHPDEAYAQSLAATPSRMYVGGSFRVAGGYYADNSYEDYYQSMGIAAWNYPSGLLEAKTSSKFTISK